MIARNFDEHISPLFLFVVIYVKLKAHLTLEENLAQIS